MAHMEAKMEAEVISELQFTEKKCTSKVSPAPKTLAVRNSSFESVTGPPSTINSFTRRRCTGRLVKISPESMLMIYDVLFFLTYGISWIITFIWNRHGIDDNAVTRVTKMYNICIGVDTYPARYFAIPMSYLFTIAFFLTVCLFLKRMLDQEEDYKRCSKLPRGILLLIAMLFNLAFAWTIGVMPVDVPTFKVHLIGFIVALFGYALLKFASIVEFAYFADMDDGKTGLSCKDMCHTWRKLIFLIVEGSTCAVLSLSTIYLSAKYNHLLFFQPLEEVASILNSTVPTETKPDFFTMPVLAVTVICPIVSFIIDPHRRHITIRFKYHHPDEEHHDGIKVVKCQDECLDTGLCCYKGRE